LDRAGLWGKIRQRFSETREREAAIVTRKLASAPDTGVTTRPETEQQQRTRLIPPYNVILENDDYHSFEFVMTVLQKVLGCARERAFQLTEEAHTTGRSVIWTGPKEVAELKVDQVRTFVEVREPDGADLGPLSCLIEPAPGA
jgi:ATP-dependent Clp protease adaptor protein ClpS